jgi:hypothetical protein
MIDYQLGYLKTGNKNSHSNQSSGVVMRIKKDILFDKALNLNNKSLRTIKLVSYRINPPI